MQIELTKSGPLLQKDGSLAQVGWARQPLLDCNLDAARFYAIQPFQFFRIKKWDYYAIFTPQYFFSATIANLGYAGNIFVYILNFETGELHEEGLVIPLGRGISLPRNSRSGISNFENKQVKLDFDAKSAQRLISVSWPGFHGGRGIKAEIVLSQPEYFESMNIVIP
nr:DUF2804 family protein [Anaerolineaceae bacterium]